MSNPLQAVSAVVGGIIGYVVSFGNPYGAAVGFSIGMGVGMALFPPESESPSPASGIKAQTSSTGLSIRYMRGKDKVSGNLLWYGNFQKHKVKSGGKGGKKKTVGYTYSVSLAWGLCVVPPGVSATLIRAWQGSEPMNMDSFRFYDGSQTSPDSHLGTNTKIGGTTVAMIPRRPVWKNLCYVVIPNHDLESSTYIKNMTFEIRIGDSDDVTPTIITTEILTNDLFGMGMDAAMVDQTLAAETDAYCAANDLLISPTFDRQLSVLDSLRWIIQHHDGYITYNDGVIAHRQLRPNTTVVPTIRTRNMVRDEGEMPAQASYKGGRDYTNKMTVEYLKRDNEYSLGTAPIEDQVDIDNYGLRDATVKLAGYKTHSRAAKMSLLLLRRNLHAPQTVDFVIGPELAGIIAGEVVNLEVPEMEINNKEYRITSISEDEDYKSVVSAIEELPNYELLQLTADSSLPSEGIDLSGDPGSVVRPMGVEIPARYSPTAGLLAITYSDSGLDTWAGAAAYSSNSASGSYEQRSVEPTGGYTGAITAIGVDYLDLVLDYSDVLESFLGFDEMMQSETGNIMFVKTTEGDRFLRFQTVELIGANEWRLTGIIDDMVRLPRFNYISSTIDVGDHVSFYIDVPHIIPEQNWYFGRTEYWKCPSYNMSSQLEDISTVSPFPVTYINAFNRPLAPVNVAANGIGLSSNALAVDNATDTVLTWATLNRFAAGMNNYTRTDATSDDAEIHSFRIDVYVGVTLKRSEIAENVTLIGGVWTRSLPPKTFTYTPGMWATDGSPATVTFKLYQLNSTETSAAEEFVLNFV